MVSTGSPAGRSTFDPVRLQAAWYVLTGIWPIVHLRSFMALTGPKRDTWLVQAFGALVAVIGLTLFPWESRRPMGHGTTDASQRRLAIGSALALSGAEIVFVGRRRIRPIYLADAALELALAALIARRPASIQASSA